MKVDHLIDVGDDLDVIESPRGLPPPVQRQVRGALKGDEAVNHNELLMRRLVPLPLAEEMFDLDKAPGNIKAGVPVPQNDAQQKPTVAGTTRPTIPGVEDVRVPASSEFKEPPTKVVATNTSVEPSR